MAFLRTPAGLLAGLGVLAAGAFFGYLALSQSGILLPKTSVNARINSLAWSDDTHLLIATGFPLYNGEIWDLETGRWLANFRHEYRNIPSVIALPDGYIASGSCGDIEGQSTCLEGEIGIWRLLEGETYNMQTFHGHSDYVTSFLPYTSLVHPEQVIT